MSPSMPITIATSNASSSSASSVASSSSSSPISSSGVYVPVHKRASVDLSASKPQRTLPIYTAVELMQLAKSPLATQQATATYLALHGQEDLAAIALNRRQQRTREYMQRKNLTVTEPVESKTNTVVTVAPVASVAAARRRPVGRAAERNSASRRTVANKLLNAASWRGQTPRHTEALPVSLTV